MFYLTLTCSKSKIGTLEKRCEICSKLTIKVPERPSFSGASIVDFEQVNISRFQETSWGDWNWRQAPSQPSKWQFLTVVLENCEKSVVKHSIEKPILLNFVKFSTIFCSWLSQYIYFIIYIFFWLNPFSSKEMIVQSSRAD